MKRSLRFLALANAATMALVLSVFGAQPAAASTYAPSSIKQTSDYILSALSTKADANDARYFSGGIWYSGDDSCFRCNVGPGVLAAVIGGRDSTNAAARQMAIDTFNVAIDLHRLPNGGYRQATTGTTVDDVQTAIFTTELGTAYFELFAYLDSATKTKWQQALAGAGDFLDTNGNLRWYTNGNINLANALAEAAAWKATGNTLYQTRYETALAFAMNPDQARWPGFGLKYTVVPTQQNGSDGAAYFAESGGGTPGFDADYVQMQLDFIIRLYQLTNDQRALRLTNLLYNQLAPRVNETTWLLDTSYGSRHPQANRYLTFSSPSQAFLSEVGGRPELKTKAASQWPYVESLFRGGVGYTNPGIYYWYGSELATWLMVNWHGEALPASSVGTAPPSSGSATTAGYWMADQTGSVYAFGAAAYKGGGATGVVVDVEKTNSGNGYWLLNSDGRLFSYGDAPNAGDIAGIKQGNERAVSVSADPQNNGYWIFTNKGRAYPFNGAPALGDLRNNPLNGAILDSVPTPSGLGYYMVGSDGGVFCFGDAAFAGSMGGKSLNAPVSGLVPDADGNGYWLVASDGGVFAFNSGFRGSMGGSSMNKPVVGMVRFGNGYLMVGSDGGIFNFSDKAFLGSLGANPPAAPVIAVASLG